MIRQLSEADGPAILEVILDAATAYRGVIPADCWHEPYMSEAELRQEIAAGVEFFGREERAQLLGVMGLQRVRDVTLIRHAYTRTADQGRGIGGQLLGHLRGTARARLLVGTWAAAAWAIRFYEHRGFSLVGPKEKDLLLKTYWTVPERQRQTSVVLATPAPRGPRSPLRQEVARLPGPGGSIRRCLAKPGRSFGRDAPHAARRAPCVFRSGGVP